MPNNVIRIICNFIIYEWRVMFPTADSEDITQVTSVKSKQTLASNERDSAEGSQVAKQNSNRDLTLNMLIKELVFCIALALTTYGALHNT